jgi:hypothetical protein
MTVEELTAQGFDRDVLESRGPVVVDFYAELLFQDGQVRATTRGLKTGEALERELGLTDPPRGASTVSGSHECVC